VEIAKVREWQKANPDLKRATGNKYYKENHSQVLSRSRERRASNIDEARWKERVRSWRRYYNLTPSQVLSIYEEQEKCCAMCEQFFPWADVAGPTELFHVDHDASTGAVRGLLCGWCNLAVGLLRDNPAAFAAGVIYLTRNVNHGVANLQELGRKKENR
jgi:hypothetical protein